MNQLTNGKTYNAIKIEYPFIRIVGDSKEDYLYSIDKPTSLENPKLFGEWPIVENKQGILKVLLINLTTSYNYK